MNGKGRELLRGIWDFLILFLGIWGFGIWDLGFEMWDVGLGIGDWRLIDLVDLA